MSAASSWVLHEGRNCYPSNGAADVGVRDGPGLRSAQFPKRRGGERRRQSEVDAARRAVDVLDEGVDVGGLALGGEGEGLVERLGVRERAREPEERRAAEGLAGERKFQCASSTDGDTNFSKTRREKTICPKISRIDVDATEKIRRSFPAPPRAVPPTRA